MNLIDSSCFLKHNGQLLRLHAEGDLAQGVAVVGIAVDLLAVCKHAEGLDEGVCYLYGLWVVVVFILLFNI